MEDSLKMASKSGRNISEYYLVVKACCATSWYWTFV